MIDKADLAAIKILARLAEDVASSSPEAGFVQFWAIKYLHHAIRHLAYPDRDVYPKVRGSRKGDPIRNVRQP